MYGALASVLLVGMWQAPGQATQSDLLQQVAVAPPAAEVKVATRLSASGVLILDRSSGQLVYGKQTKVRRPMASITKLMTALIIVENQELDEIVTIPKAAELIAGNKVYLKAGEKFTVEDLLSALLIASANDASIALAQFHSGSVSAFAEEMNQRAEQLGLQDTSYANPSGLDSPLQFSTPRDIAWLTEYIMKNEFIASRMQRKWDRIYSFQGTDIPLSHTHALLHSDIESVVGGKTGTTLAAKQCLVSVVSHAGNEYIMVLLNSDKRYADMNVLLKTVLDQQSDSVV